MRDTLYRLKNIGFKPNIWLSQHFVPNIDLFGDTSIWSNVRFKLVYIRTNSYMYPCLSVPMPFFLSVSLSLCLSVSLSLCLSVSLSLCLSVSLSLCLSLSLTHYLTHSHSLPGKHNKKMKINGLETNTHSLFSFSPSFSVSFLFLSHFFVSLSLSLTHTHTHILHKVKQKDEKKWVRDKLVKAATSAKKRQDLLLKGPSKNICSHFLTILEQFPFLHLELFQFRLSA